MRAPATHESEAVGSLLGAEFAHRLGLVGCAGPRPLCLPFSDVISNTMGFVHGGAVASLALAAAEVAARESQRGALGEARPVSVAVLFLKAVAGRDLVAGARVVSRGREVAQVEASVTDPEGTAVASLLSTWRLSDGPEPAGAVTQTARRDRAWHALGSDLPGLEFSPYSKGLGARITRCDREGAAMTLPLAGNRGADGRLHEGPLLGAIDTCAALAAKGSLDPEPFRGGATLSISLVLAGAVRSDLRLGSRSLSAAGELFTQDIEASDASGRIVATALASYRIRREAS
jgi:uncharacterized protein (TIGR00369 family)